MAYFNFFDLLKYIFNSIRYRVIKHIKIFTILLIVFVVAFLFGTQSKAFNVPNFDTNFSDKYYILYKAGGQNCFVYCNKNGADNPPFYLRISSVNGTNYLTAYSPRQYNLNYGFFTSDGSMRYWQNNAQYVYLIPSEQLQNNPNIKANNFDVYGFINGGLLYPSNPYVLTPSISTDSSTIQDWSFDSLTINGNSVSPFQELEGYTYHKIMYLTYNYNGFSYFKEIPFDYIDTFLDNNNYKFTINIPKSFFNNSLYLVENAELNLTLSIKEEFESNDITNYFLGNYNITISSDMVSDINNTTEKDIQDNIYQEQQKTNDNLENLQQQQQQTNDNLNNINNSLTDSEVDENNVNDIADLSNGFSVTDNTGIDQLFQMVYNAFCSNNPEDLVFTIPFTNKEVTINQSNISSKFPEPITNIVGIFVWGFVGLYVLKDIRSMINKISEGSPEDVGSDVKKEVL